MAEFKCEPSFNDRPIHSVLLEWLQHNVSIPENAATWFSHVGFLILTWFVVKFTIRFVLSVVWPVFIICIGLAIYRLVEYANNDDLGLYLSSAFPFIYEWLIKIAARLFQLFLKLFDTDK